MEDIVLHYSQNILKLCKVQIRIFSQPHNVKSKGLSHFIPRIYFLF